MAKVIEPNRHLKTEAQRRGALSKAAIDSFAIEGIKVDAEAPKGRFVKESARKDSPAA